MILFFKIKIIILNKYFKKSKQYHHQPAGARVG
jgi:hypothetical protein